MVGVMEKNKLMDDDVAKIRSTLAKIETVLTHIREDQKKKEEEAKEMKEDIYDLQKFQHSSTGMSKAVMILLTVLSGVLGIILAIQSLS